MKLSHLAVYDRNHYHNRKSLEARAINTKAEKMNIRLFDICSFLYEDISYTNVGINIYKNYVYNCLHCNLERIDFGNAYRICFNYIFSYQR